MSGIRRSFGGVAIPVTRDGVVLAIPDREQENGGKKEGLAWGRERVPVTTEQYQYPGGRRDYPDEPMDVLLVREWLQETGFRVDSERFEPLPVGTAVCQSKDGPEQWFGVELFKLVLAPEEELSMRRAGAVEVERFDGHMLRRRDQIISNLFFAVCEEVGILV